MLTNNQRPLFKIGEYIAGRYEVIRALGQGAMGAVVHVLDHALDKEPTALKILHPQVAEDEIQFLRFRNEVLLARTLLAHPNIVRIFDFGESESGLYYLSMEYVGGGVLGSKIYTRGTGVRLNFGQIVEVLVNMCDGLFAAHSRGVIHRDLKPDNVLLTADGMAKITDFGLARAMNSDQHFTMTGETVGTPFYMSPEQLAGESPDARCDIYSLGIMAYEMIMQKRPFNSENYLELAHMHMVSAMPEINCEHIDVPKWFNEFIMTCTAKDREDRFTSALEAADFLLMNLAPSPIHHQRRPYRLFPADAPSISRVGFLH